jgi:protease-4
VASDTIRRAVVRARKAGKPVFISMGSLAASGGYFVGMEGQRIFANPATLVGSIGVFGGKLALQDLYGKLNVNWGQVAVGDKALMWSSNAPFTATTRAAFERSIDFVFADFSAKARAARKLNEEAWPGLIGGRVLTGTDGVAAGLVDTLGTFRDTLDAARAAVQLTPENSRTVILYPEQLSPLEAVREALSGGQFMQAAQMLALAAETQGALATLMAPFAPRQVMEMPDMRLTY